MQENENLKKDFPILKEELKIQFPKDLKDLFNLDYYIKSYKRIKVENNFNENLKYGKLDCFGDLVIYLGCYLLGCYF